MDIDYKGLEEYMNTLKDEDFEKYRNPRKDCPMKEVDESKMKYGDMFLVDVIGNDLSIVTYTKRKYKIEGRSVNCKLDKTIISDCRKIYGTPLNGYWEIPKQFITA